MLDGVFEPAAPRRNPRFLDARQMLLLLRADARGIKVEPLALKLAKESVDLFEEGMTARMAARPDDGPPLAGAEIDAAVDEILAPVPTPSLEQVNAGRNAIADYLMSDEALDGLNAALACLLTACRSDSPYAVKQAAEAVRLAANTALRRGYDPEVLRRVLIYWSQVTPGAPTINVEG